MPAQHPKAPLEELDRHYEINNVFWVGWFKVTLGTIAQILLNCTMIKLRVPENEESEQLACGRHDASHPKAKQRQDQGS